MASSTEELANVYSALILQDNNSTNAANTENKQQPQGVYKNPRLMHVCTSVVGHVVHLQTNDGSIWEGILNTFSPEFTICLDLAIQLDSKQEDDCLYAALKRGSQAKQQAFFDLKDIVRISVADVDLNYATKDMAAGKLATDADISGFDASKLSEHRELESWQDDGDNVASESLLSLDDVANKSGNQSNSRGWDAQEMFNFNQRVHKVTSTYDEKLAEYTVPVPKHQGKEWSLKRERAEALAKEIESSSKSQSRLAKEDGSDCEEEKFSAVLRPVQNATTTNSNNSLNVKNYPRQRPNYPRQRPNYPRPNNNDSIKTFHQKFTMGSPRQQRNQQNQQQQSQQHPPQPQTNQLQHPQQSQQQPQQHTPSSNQPQQPQSQQHQQQQQQAQPQKPAPQLHPQKQPAQPHPPQSQPAQLQHSQQPQQQSHQHAQPSSQAQSQQPQQPQPAQPHPPQSQPVQIQHPQQPQQQPQQHTPPSNQTQQQQQQPHPPQTQTQTQPPPPPPPPQSHPPQPQPTQLQQQPQPQHTQPSNQTQQHVQQQQQPQQQPQQQQIHQKQDRAKSEQLVRKFKLNPNAKEFVYKPKSPTAMQAAQVNGAGPIPAVGGAVLDPASSSPMSQAPHGAYYQQVPIFTHGIPPHQQQHPAQFMPNHTPLHFQSQLHYMSPVPTHFPPQQIAPRYIRGQFQNYHPRGGENHNNVRPVYSQSSIMPATSTGQPYAPPPSGAPHPMNAYAASPQQPMVYGGISQSMYPVVQTGFPQHMPHMLPNPAPYDGSAVYMPPQNYVVNPH